MNLLNPSRRNARWLILLALLAYWAISLSGLDALPTVRDDEPWQAAPGYSFWTRGVYGSELFADFAGMGQHYYLFQPTFSLLLGLAGRLWGLGLFQIRIVPVMLGGLTLCLTYRVALRQAQDAARGEAAGVIAACLLLLWRWGVSTPTLASGIPLLDISRIARYDTLVPVWGLSAWLMLSHAQQHGQGRHFFLAGLFAGLAGMAHLYGLFWVPALAIILFADSGWSLLKQRTIYALAAGAVVAWVPWLLFIAAGWDDFVLQTSQYANRFDLLSPSFYARNLLYETQRYGFGPTNLVSAASQPGVWLLVLGLPAALVWLSALSLSKRARAERPLVALVVPAWLFPLGFAVLLVQKTPGYLQSIAPLFAVVIAWVAVDLWQARRRRGLLVAAAMLVALDGGWGILHQQQLAADSTNTGSACLKTTSALTRRSSFCPTGRSPPTLWPLSASWRTSRPMCLFWTRFSARVWPKATTPQVRTRSLVNLRRTSTPSWIAITPASWGASQTKPMAR
ncbi:MAG: glycosyltransferase family 39 protein [Chloroflexi bacterium]|nr:glycosyltransferase family 39 protein [Chloroflexota bacterium]